MSDHGEQLCTEFDRVRVRVSVQKVVHKVRVLRVVWALHVRYIHTYLNRKSTLKLKL